MKLSKWAEQQGLHYQTAWKLFRDGKLPVKASQLPTGTILVEESDSPQGSGKCIVYCRVSNHSRKEELRYQVDRCAAFCASRGLTVDKVFKEVASGLNDNRREFWKALDSKPSVLVVEHKDRLTRFGFNYLERLLKERGCELLVINRDTEDRADILKDLASVVYSFCAKLYGMRRAQNKAQKVRDAMNNDS